MDQPAMYLVKENLINIDYRYILYFASATTSPLNRLLLAFRPLSFITEDGNYVVLRYESRH